MWVWHKVTVLHVILVCNIIGDLNLAPKNMYVQKIMSKCYHQNAILEQSADFSIQCTILSCNVVYCTQLYTYCFHVAIYRLPVNVHVTDVLYSYVILYTRSQWEESELKRLEEKMVRRWRTRWRAWYYCSCHIRYQSTNDICCQQHRSGWTCSITW